MLVVGGSVGGGAPGVPEWGTPPTLDQIIFYGPVGHPNTHICSIQTTNAVAGLGREKGEG